MLIQHIKKYIKPLIQGVMGGRIVWNQNNSTKSIHLTFDDGPHPVYTPILLDLLDRFSVKGTFFLVGTNVNKFPELAREIVQRGHQVGSHSFNHTIDLQKGITNCGIEINECNKTIYLATDQRTHLFRPPWGTITLRQLAYCIRNRIKIILWSYDSLDYKKERRNNMIMDVHDGDIVLLHDDAIYCINILTEEIPRILNMGYTFDIIRD